MSVPAVDDEPRRTGAVVATAGAAVAGLVLAGVTVFGIASASSSEPAQVDDPIVLYGER